MTSPLPKAVLIVEDESIVAHDIQQTLLDQGYDAFAIASSGQEAIARASERCPDLVLMDIRIKGDIDGITTAGVLRARFDVPVVYLTAHADTSTIERAKKTEPYGYLIKPVTPADLRSSVEIALYRHQMDKRLRERELWFSTTLRSIGDAVVTVDLAGRVSFMNPTAEQLTGVALEDALGRPAPEIVRLLPPAPPSPLDDALGRAATAAIPEAILERTNLPSRIISDSTARVIDRGEVLGAVMVFRDITEQKRLQKQLELADRLASLGTMAAGVAHEVNNPLAVVVANGSFVCDKMKRLLSQLHSDDVPREDMARQLERTLEAQLEIQAAASRIGRIVADLNAFSRPLPQTPGEANVARSIEWAVRSTSHEFLHRAAIRTDVAALPPVAIDETRLGQILVNLLLNAAHAIPPGNVERNHVAVIARAAANNQVVIEVRDTGAGMPPDTLARIFEPFFTTKPVGVGTGFGLAICHGIVTSVGGDLQAESRVGEGTVFRLILPASIVKGTEPTALSASAASAARHGRILVIDDEDMVRRAIGRILEGQEIVLTASAREALTLLAGGQTFDIIFSDIMMPEMTGMEFYEELLKSRPEDARRVVFLSGGATTPRVSDFLASVPNLRLEKPFEVAGLRHIVQQLLAAIQGA